MRPWTQSTAACFGSTARMFTVQIRIAKTMTGRREWPPWSSNKVPRKQGHARCRTNLGGTFTFANTNLPVSCVGYGAMQLAGPQVWGPPRDPEEAVRVLREALDAAQARIDPGRSWL